MTSQMIQHRAIRDRVGITDRSGMGVVRVAGDDARLFLHGLLAGNIENLAENAVRHTLLLDEHGEVVSDVHVYNNFDECFVTCEPARRTALFARLADGAPDGITVEDVSDRHAAFAIEGPYAWQVPQQLVGVEAGGLRPMNFIRGRVGRADVLLSRVGGTGEYGYLIIGDRDAAPDLLERLRQAAPEAPLCSAEAHDLLRLEVRSFNQARDLPNGESPLEAGLHWMIHFRKPSFVGADAVRAEQARGPVRKMIAIRIAHARAPVPLAGVFDGPQRIGYVANAGVSPDLGSAIALAFVDPPYAWVGLPLRVEAPDGLVAATTVSSPFIVTKSTSVQIA